MSNKYTFTTLIILAFVVIINYGKVIQNEYSLDDHYYLSQISSVETISDIPSSLKLKFSIVDYRPIATLSFALEKVFISNSPNPSTSHIINLILYILNGWMLFFILNLFSYSKQKKYFSLLTTILFLILPLHTSMVANVKSRDGLLSFLFGITYFYFVIRLLTVSDKWVTKLFLLFSAIICIILGIYSKLDAFNFLLITPILFIIFNKKINFKNVLRFLIITLVTFQSVRFLFNNWIENRTEAIVYTSTVEQTPYAENLSDPIIFTENPIVEYESLSYKLAYVIQTVFEYIFMVFKPSGHYFYYGYDMVPVLPLSDPTIWLKLSLILILICSAIWMYNKNKLYSFSIAFFFISLIYCSNFITPVSGIVADRYAYVASMGACIGLSIWIFSATEFLKSKLSKIEWNTKSSNILLVSPFVIIFIIYLPFNQQRSKDWKNLFSIFEADLPKIGHQSYEANRIALKNYVETGIDTDQPQLRKEYFQKGLAIGKQAMEIYPDGQLAQEGIIMSIYGLEDFYGAVNFSRKVIEKFDTTEIGWRMLTEYYYINKQLDSAAMGYRKLIDILPSDPNLYFFYVTTLQQNNQMDLAIQYLDSLASKQPKSYLPEQAKTYLYLETKDTAQAVFFMEKAMEKGWRDNKILDIAGKYWWTKDQVKWESLKKYFQE